MDRSITKKRPRGRPRATNGVIILPIHRNLDISAVSRAFVELGLALGKKRVILGMKGAKNAGL